MQISRAGVLGCSLQTRNMKEQIGDWAHNAGGHSLSKVKMPASNSKICTKLYYESRRKKYVSEENLGVCEGVSIDPSRAGCAGVK